MNLPDDTLQDTRLMFNHTTSTLFSLIGRYENFWKRMNIEVPEQKIKFYPAQEKDFLVRDIEFDILDMIEEFVTGFKHFGNFYSEILSSEDYGLLEKMASFFETTEFMSFSFQNELWARIIYDFIFLFNLWTKNREKLINILLPLCFGKLADIAISLQKHEISDFDILCGELANAFEMERNHLIHKSIRWEKI